MNRLVPDLPDPDDFLEWLSGFHRAPDKCILDENGELIPATLEEWMRFMQGPQRVIEQEYFMDRHYKVSTVFIGLDHGYGAKPLYFETLVFGPEEERQLLGQPIMIRPELWGYRTETLTEAKEAHQAGVSWLQEQDFYETA